MGAYVSSFQLASCASCLCGASPCVLSGCCSKASTSIVTRLVFALFLFLGTMVSIFMVLTSTGPQLPHIPGFCLDSNSSWLNGSNSSRSTDLKENCGLVGYRSVYRMCVPMACFFLLFSMIMFRVRTSRDRRAALQNGFWFYKILILLGMITGAFYIHDERFDKVWYYFGLSGSICFIIIQLILMVDWTYSWNESWVGKAQEGKKAWYAALLCFTLLFYSASVASIVWLCKYYTQPDDCAENKLVIGFSALFCCLVSVGSVLRKVQKRQPSSGLLQASFISFYTMYLIWSGFTNNPNRNCNPSLLSLIFNSSTPHLANVPEQEQKWDIQGIVGLVLFTGCTLYASLRSSTNSQVDKLLLTGKGGDVSRGVWSSPGEGKLRRAVDNEQDGVIYCYSLFHAFLSLASLYVMMTITDWYHPDATLQAMQSTMPAFWVKVCSGWLGVAVYLLTLVGPLMCPSRDFS